MSGWRIALPSPYQVFSKNEIQVGQLHVCFVIDFLLFLPSPVLHANELFINQLLQCQV